MCSRAGATLPSPGRARHARARHRGDGRVARGLPSPRPGRFVGELHETSESHTSGCGFLRMPMRVTPGEAPWHDFKQLPPRDAPRAHPCCRPPHGASGPGQEDAQLEGGAAPLPDVRACSAATTAHAVDEHDRPCTDRDRRHPPGRRHASAPAPSERGRRPRSRLLLRAFHPKSVSEVPRVPLARPDTPSNRSSIPTGAAADHS